MSLARFFFRSRPSHAHNLVVLGSSSSEAFDYVMGPNPAYFPFWASGWSARGLRASAMQAYIAKIMGAVPKESHVLLNFGVADVLFNARHRACQTGFYNFEQHVAEAVSGIHLTAKNLRKMGFRSVYPVFVSPIVAVPRRYWGKPGEDGPQLADPQMGRMYHAICEKLSVDLECIDTFEEMSLGPKGHFLLRPEFARERPDHHPNYVATQDILKKKLRRLPGMPPFRPEPHLALYPHTQTPIKALVAEGRTRPRTCR